MPENMLPIAEDPNTGLKQWNNYSLILTSPDVNVQKLNYWVKLDIMENTKNSIKNLKDDLRKFDDFD